MAHLYSNENFSQRVVEVLREFGHDVLTSFESGRANQAIPDEDVLAFAVEKKRIMITFNRKHFMRLHREQPEHFGIIVCTIDADVSALGQRIHGMLIDHADLKGKLIRINRPVD